MRSVFIILSTGHIGGAEKRFAGLWRSFAEIEDKSGFRVFLVLNTSLCERLADTGIINADHPNIIAGNFSEKNFITYRANIRKLIRERASKNDIVHFIGYSPANFFIKPHSLLSVTASHINVEGLKTRLFIYLSVLFTDRADVLDKSILKHLRNLFFWRRKKFHQTSNSFCNTDIYRPGEKKDHLVFLGRFSPVKQVKELLLSVPAIYQAIKAKHKTEASFYFLGHGDMEKELSEITEGPAFKNIPIHIYYEKNPSQILNESKIFFSLQLYNNYPSRSLLEAMSAGNIPLVTDIGETRLLARPEFSYYVPEKFSAVQLAEQVVDIFSLSNEELQRKAELARAFVMKEHTIEKMREYYLGIYKKVANG